MIATRLKQLLRWQKKLLAAIYDFVAVVFALWMSFYFRLLDTADWANNNQWWWQWWQWILLGGVIALPIFYISGLYRFVIRHANHNLLWFVAKGVTFSAIAWGGVMLWMQPPNFPRSVIFIYWFIAFAMIGGGRLVAQAFMRSSRGISVIIYGAGVRGAQLATSLQHDTTYHPVAFMDDQRHLLGSQVMDLRVHNPKDFVRLHKQYDIKEVWIAIHFEDKKDRQRMLSQFQDFPVRVKVLPSISELAQRKLKTFDFETITAQDLLGREPVVADQTLLETKIRGKCVMITGAGGTIGSELCHQVAALQATKIVLLDHSEHALYEINKSLRQLDMVSRPSIVPVLGSVCNRQLLGETMNQHKVQTIYHAAAYKHVPLVESNLLVGIYNNVFGTLILAEEAIQKKVETMILISTDKAVRPSSIMGKSKRLSEMVLQALSVEHQQIDFGMVRFGNVLDSSGSVVPLFREQIRKKLPLTVTHPDMTRYFMTQREAVELVIQAGAMARHGDVFVLDMGEPVKINDLARMMIHLSAYQVKDAEHPDGDIEIQYTGIREGEKITEELLISGNTSETNHTMILRAHDSFIPWQKLQVQIEKMRHLHSHNDNHGCAQLLEQVIQEGDKEHNDTNISA